MSVETRTKEYLIGHYGHLIHAENPVFDTDRNVYIARLHSSYPIMITDDRSDKRFIRYIRVPYLGEIVLNEKMNVVRDDTTDYATVNELLTKFLRIWADDAEEYVMRASAKKIVKLPWIPTVLNPVKEIIDQLWRHSKLEQRIIDMGQSKGQAGKYKRYLKLLEEVGLVRYYEGIWYPGNEFNKIQSQVSDIQEGREYVFGIILEKRYKVLKHAFQVRNLEGLMKIENAVYLPEIKEDRQLFREPKSLVKDLQRFYDDRFNLMQVESKLLELSEVGAIEAEDDLFAGNNEIRSGIIYEKSKAPDIESKWLQAMT